jgi:hypothetical protein
MARRGAGTIEAAAQKVLREGLLHGRSGFTPDREIWTEAHAQELMDCYVSQPDISGASFEDKLQKQLGNATDGAVQLFAELYYLSLLPLSDYKGKTKRRCIRFALDQGNREVSIPGDMDAPLDLGVFNGGVAFKTRRYFQIAFLVEFAHGVLQRSSDERAALLADPIEFRNTMSAVTKVNAPSQQHGLEYLAFPKFFLPIAKTEHRRQIRTTFLNKIGETTGDEDRDLAEITEAITAEVGGAFDYYKEPYRSKWDPKAAARTGPVPEQDPWTGLLHWATRMAESIDLNAEEREYKVKMAQQISAAMELALVGDDRWLDGLRKALNTNLLATYFKVALFDDLKAKPAEFRSMVFEVWESRQGGAALDVLQARLKALSGSKQYTPGNAAALGSVLLMARDLAEYPPYRPTPVQTLCRLTNTPPPGNAPSQRYDVLLGLCDELIERAGDTDLEVQDRLDAQSLLWAVAQYAAPESWSPAERDAFLAWRGDVTAEDETTRRAWLVRGSSVNGRDLIPTWLIKGSVSLAASKLREVTPGLSREQLKVIVDEDYAHASYADKASKVDEFHAFLSRMQPGDIVVTTSQGRMYVGTVEGPATYRKSEDERSNLRRDVTWANREGIDYSELPADVASRLQVQYEVVDMTRELDLLEPYLAGGAAEESEEPPSESPARKLVLRDADDELATKLHVDKAWLQECIDLLRDRPQLIFYGPPGTGKTYIATYLAEHLAGDNVRLVQFHPAYSYEDFFEGYRPEPGGGFGLKPGPMRKVVDKARENPATPYFLIIDEINRGNLAKIFGELYFLLEYRDHNVDLLYATNDDIGFTLPRNVFIIGTMNTADRSIALVDAAMRRRFAFLPLHPTETPTSGVLRRWLDANDHPPLAADLLDELNRRIEDPDFKIGPSYFMRPAVHEPGGLERAWRTAIMPLLEEFHYGEGKDLENAYGLARVLAAVNKGEQSANGQANVAHDQTESAVSDLVGGDEAPGAD